MGTSSINAAPESTSNQLLNRIPNNYYELKYITQNKQALYLSQQDSSEQISRMKTKSNYHTMKLEIYYMSAIALPTKGKCKRKKKSQHTYSTNMLADDS